MDTGTLDLTPGARPNPVVLGHKEEYTHSSLQFGLKQQILQAPAHHEEEQRSDDSPAVQRTDQLLTDNELRQLRTTVHLAEGH